VSIIRVGLAQTRNFGDGYDAIFGKKTTAEKKEGKTVASAKKPKATGKKTKKAKKK
jgi:hypothetical protein